MTDRFSDCFNKSKYMLMEGALAERLKNEFNIKIDENVALASIIYGENKRTLRRLYKEYIDIAANYNIPIMISTPTRRANKERVSSSNYNEEIILDNVKFLKSIRDEYKKKDIFVGGLMGCIGDAYKGETSLTIKEAYEFHSWQVNLFKKANVDYLYAGIMPEVSEAVGMAKAMEQTGIPYIISFTIRRDGRLLDGTTIADAIKIINSKTKNNPICYMSNCVHPNIVLSAINQSFNNGIIKKQFIGIQANAADFEVEDLEDNSKIIKESSAEELAHGMRRLYKGGFKIFGGCCGTNVSHIRCIADMLIK